MLVVFLKSAILFLVMLLVLRIMGKRQIGEMQPFELVITLVIAEVACIPMNDPYIPLYYGIIPIATLGFLHLILTIITSKSVKARSLISGRSVTVIDKSGIRYDSIKKMNINTLDLLEAVRSAGYPDFNNIAYAIFETNGKLCVIEKESDPKAKKPAFLPMTLFMDGSWFQTNLSTAGVDSSEIEELFKQNGYKKPKDILYADIRQNGLVYINPKEGNSFTGRLKLNNASGW